MAASRQLLELRRQEKTFAIKTSPSFNDYALIKSGAQINKLHMRESNDIPEQIVHRVKLNLKYSRQ